MPNIGTMSKTQLTTRLTRIEPHRGSALKNIYQKTVLISFSGTLYSFKTPSLKEIEKSKWLWRVEELKN